MQAGAVASTGRNSGNRHLCRLRPLRGGRVGPWAARLRPKGALGDFLVDWPGHLATGRKPNSSSKSAFSDSGHSQASSGDWDKIAAERPHPKVADIRSRPLCI